MKYYIYPKSKNSETIVDLISFFNEDISYDFIDDSCDNSSLSSLAKTIKNNNVPVLLASDKYKDKLLRNLKEHSIENYQDGISLYANKITEYLAQRVDTKKNKIGIVLSGIANEKHIANMDKLLLSLGYEVVYVCLSLKIYNQNLTKINNTVSIVANHDVLKLIDFFDCVISVTAVSLSKAVFSINLTHAFCEPLSLPAFLGVSAAECGNSYANTTRYFCASSKRTSLALKSIFSTHEHPVVLDVGYPSLDVDIKEYNSISEAESHEYVIFAMNKMPSVSFMSELIDGVAEIGRVLLFRPHPLYVSSPNVIAIIDAFADNRHFKLDLSPRLDLIMIKKSTTLITDYSSLGYTYPFVSLKPCVIYNTDSCDFVVENQVTFFYDQNIHYAASTVCELLDCIKLIYKDIDENKSKIQKYRNEQIFNLGNSAEYIIQFIKDNLDKENCTRSR